MEQIKPVSQSASSERSGNPPPHSAPAMPLPVMPSKALSPAKRLLWGTVFAVATTLSATVGLALAWVAPLPKAVAPHNNGQPSLKGLLQAGFQYQLSRPVQILVMGIDRVPGAKDSAQAFEGRSDTMLLLRIDPLDNSVNMLSIPRDTQVEIPSLGTSKVNQANASGGPAMAAEVVSNSLNGVKIDRYVRVSTDAFRELVDLLGGVKVFVPEPMSYVDNTQKLKIDLSPGWQRLNGDQAEQFARFRHDQYGDIGRVQRQQALIKALRGQLTSPAVIPRIPQILRVMQKYIDTNLSLEEMLALIGVGLNLDQNKFKMVMLPGRFSTPDEYIASYWIMNPGGRDRVMREYFKLDPTSTAQVGEVAAADLRIAIQNASGEPQVGTQVAQYLQNQGFPNVYVVQDWLDQQKQTEVIVQQGDLESATALQNVLGIGTIEAASTGDLESDLTIRVGRDWVAK